LRPCSVGKRIFRQVIDDRIEHDAIASTGHEGRICFQFLEDVIVSMVGVEDNKNPIILISNGTYIGDYLGCNGRSLDHMYLVRHGMCFYARAIVRPDIDVNPYYPSPGHARVENLTSLGGVAIVEEGEKRCTQ